jgi:Carboxypeptidase regulatory-like domain/TonB dependent receptor
VLTTSNVRSCCAWATVLLFTLLFVAAIVPYSALAQSESASVSGRVTDQQNAVIPNVEVELRNVDTNSTQTTKTNGDGIYSFPSLRPGNYVMSVRKEQFQTVSVTGITLNVQDNLSRNFVLQIGSSAVSVTVEANGININTTDASVSTVVDRQFAENLPMNGRSFQTLVQLTPGVVLVPVTQGDAGQFSVNGQRATSNYWMVDGVSANIGINAVAGAGQGVGGTVGSYSALGGTNSIVSVDAMQEFRIQTSTFAPEFGRTPGAQISIVTRSGANQFHGALFDYFRNDVLDANDWFADNKGLPKPKERQNDFGGTFSGPFLKDKTFFFFSYEGLRLRLPQTELTNVPDQTSRQNAIPAMQTFLDAYPMPNGPDNVATGVAQFNSSFSNPGTLDAYSLRIDHRVNEKLSLFGRYNYSPSGVDQRGSGENSLSTQSRSEITTQTGTAGLTWAISPAIVNDFRFNYSRTASVFSFSLDNFGGAVPPTSLPFPSGFSTQNASFGVVIAPLGFSSGAGIFVGHNANNLQRQLNIVDSVSVQKNSHSLKFGVDFRRLSPQITGFNYDQTGFFTTLGQEQSGNPLFTLLESRRPVTLDLRNLGLFAQDGWRVVPRLTFTYGLRWDVDFAPSSINGPSFEAVTGFNLGNLSNLALAPLGTPTFRTQYGNVAPRVGIAYQLSQRGDWQTVLRGGFGVFYDLATAETGNALPLLTFPFGALTRVFGASFPLT